MLTKQTTIFRRLLSITLLVLLQGLGLNLTSQNTSQSQPETANKSAVQANYASLPLAFEPNQGQVAGEAQFLVHHGQATTYFDGANTTTSIGDSKVTMSLDGANTPNFTGTDVLESKTNYFIGNDQSKWHSDVPNYKQLFAKNVYSGIDLRYYGNNSQLEHDFIVSPNVDYKQIAFHFDGQENLSLDNDGNLVLKTGESDLRLNAPTTYQQTTNTKHTIPSRFELNNDTVTITLNADYDHSQPLIIDPVLVYSTYLGGSGSDIGNAITTDAGGNVYLIGNTDSSDFPTASPYQGTKGAIGDVFVAKFDSTGTVLIYSTYLGGNVDDIGRGIVVDNAGNAYITGWTNSSDFPTVSPIQLDQVGTDAFIAKLNPSGSALVYATYLGGSAAAGGTGTDVGMGISIDSAGNAYIVGETGSANFPTAGSPLQGTKGGVKDAFIAKLNPSGSALVFSTFLGGNGNDTGYSIDLDTSNNVYVTGQTASTSFPTASPFQAIYGGSTDAFVAKLNPSGSTLIYSTYLGGTGSDISRDITIGSSDNAYISGYTNSTNFPTSSPFQTSNGGGYDAFAIKLNVAGSALNYSTYLGGSASDFSTAVVVDPNGNAYISGSTDSANFPISSSPFQTTYGGSTDVFITKLNAAGSASIYSTYLGGSGTDTGSGIGWGLNGNVYITGQTSSTNFPISSPFQTSNAGGTGDAFITQLSENTVVVTGLLNPSLTFSIGSTTCNMGFFSATQTQYCTHTMSAGSNATGGYVISYIPTTTLTSGANTIDAMATQGASVVGSEQFGLNLKANTAAGSFTSTDFGASESGGSGTAMSGYQTSNLFKFLTGGDNIAQTTAPSTPTVYTASYITNITTTSEAGIYSAPVTYNIVASY
jgi:hypothetical protein